MRACRRARARTGASWRALQESTSFVHAEKTERRLISSSNSARFADERLVASKHVSCDSLIPDKVRFGEDAETSTRVACAPQTNALDYIGVRECFSRPNFG
jgi:hypothetical protein